MLCYFLSLLTYYLLFCFDFFCIDPKYIFCSAKHIRWFASLDEDCFSAYNAIYEAKGWRLIVIFEKA